MAKTKITEKKKKVRNTTPAKFLVIILERENGIHKQAAWFCNPKDADILDIQEVEKKIVEDLIKELL